MVFEETLGTYNQLFQAFWLALFCTLLTIFSIKSAFLFSFPLFLFSIWVFIDRLLLNNMPTVSVIVFNVLQVACHYCHFQEL